MNKTDVTDALSGILGFSIIAALIVKCAPEPNELVAQKESGLGETILEEDVTRTPSLGLVPARTELLTDYMFGVIPSPGYKDFAVARMADKTENCHELWLAVIFMDEEEIAIGYCDQFDDTENIGIGFGDSLWLAWLSQPNGDIYKKEMRLGSSFDGVVYPYPWRSAFTQICWEIYSQLEDDTSPYLDERWSAPDWMDDVAAYDQQAELILTVERAITYYETGR